MSNTPNFLRIPGRFDDEFRRRALEALSQKAPRPHCPMCGNSAFSIGDGFINHALSPDVTSGALMSRPLVPSIMVVCNNCGFISTHALGALGLLPAQQGRQP